MSLPILISKDYTWIPSYINSKFRIFRYDKNDYVPKHTDGPYQNYKEKSFFSVVVYLNTIYSEFTDGQLFIYYSSSHNISIKYIPEEGLIVVFPHHYLHESKPIIHDTKYVARTDVVYRRKSKEYGVNSQCQNILSFEQIGLKDD